MKNPLLEMFTEVSLTAAEALVASTALLLSVKRSTIFLGNFPITNLSFPYNCLAILEFNGKSYLKLIAKLFPY